jgi:hypothetical protein
VMSVLVKLPKRYRTVPTVRSRIRVLSKILKWSRRSWMLPDSTRGFRHLCSKCRKSRFGFLLKELLPLGTVRSVPGWSNLTSYAVSRNSGLISISIDG